jgi:hypothetical protein
MTPDRPAYSRLLLFVELNSLAEQLHRLVIEHFLQDRLDRGG